MFTEEKAKEGMQKYSDFLEKSKIQMGVIYNALGDFGFGQNHVTEFVFDVSHFRFEEGVHLDLCLLSNMQQVGTLHFYFKEGLPEPPKEFIENDIRNDDIYDIEDLSKVLKLLVVGNIKKEVYLEEKKRLEEELNRVTEFIKEHNIGE